MKTIKEFLNLNEAFNMQKAGSKPEFRDSQEATAFMETLDDLLHSPALAAWAKETDLNDRSVNTRVKLINAKGAYSKFLKEMM